MRLLYFPYFAVSKARPNIEAAVTCYSSSSSYEYDLGGTIALLLQDHRTVSTKSVCNSLYMVTDQHRTTGEQIKHSTLHCHVASVNDDRNRTVFSSRRKTRREGAFRTCCARAQNTRGYGCFPKLNNAVVMTQNHVCFRTTEILKIYNDAISKPVLKKFDIHLHKIRDDMDASQN